MIKRFDIIRLKTTKNIKWLSGPAGRPADPRGNWSVIAGVEDTDRLLISKDETTAQVPESDVIKVADYGFEHAIESIKKIRTKTDIEKYPLLKEMEDGEEEKSKTGGRRTK
jgi:hypothetical protein